MIQIFLIYLIIDSITPFNHYTFKFYEMNIGKDEIMYNSNPLNHHDSSKSVTSSSYRISIPKVKANRKLPLNFLLLKSKQMKLRIRKKTLFQMQLVAKLLKKSVLLHHSKSLNNLQYEKMIRKKTN